MHDNKQQTNKGPLIFGQNFRIQATVRAAAIRQEIAPQTISTKDVYQSKHMVAAQIGEARRARRRPAKQILIQLTILYYDQQCGSSLLTHTQNH